jgi:ribosomal protein S18 acetylase RimI-like enzyme
VVTAAQVRVRPCEARDLEHFGAFGSERHVEYCRDEFSQAESKVILVAVSEDDVPVGKIHVHFEHREGAVWLEAAAVARPWQGQGIGTALVRAAEVLAAERGFGIAELGVEDSNPRARRLYERLGYRSVARNDFRYEGAPVPNPGVTLRKELA